MNQSTCCIHECGKPIIGKFLCSAHYSRLRRTGTTDLRVKLVRKCRMPECDGKHFQHGWCSKHFQRIANTGSPFDKDQKWVIGDHASCLACGESFIPEYGLRRYCSVACRTTYSRFGQRPEARDCARCGAVIDMTIRGNSGSRRYRSVKMCRACSGSPNLTRFVPLLIERDGNDCRLCGAGIDLSLVYPDPMSRSVDHVLPRSLGGTESVANLRLAHLICNIKRQNRIDYVAA